MADLENKNEGNNEEVKADNAEKKEDAVKQDVPAEDMTAPIEQTAHTEEKAAPETAAPKAEPPHVAAQPIAAEPGKKEKKAKKSFPWKPVLKVAGVAALSIGCGFGGGYLAGQQSAQSTISSAQSQLSDANGFGGQMQKGDSGSSDFSGRSFPGSDSSSGSSDSNGSSTVTTGAALGIYVQTNTDNQVVIAGFSDNSNAETAGLKTGDIITALDGTTVSSYNEITTFLSSKSAGDKVKVTVTRDGSSTDATITLVEKSGMSSSSNGSSSSGSTAPSMGKQDAQSGSTSNSSSGSSSSSSSLQG